MFGYYLEVTNSYKNLVPEHYVRRQTLANAERYITPKLKELEDMILGAEDKLVVLEYEYFCEIRKKIADQVVRIQQTAKAVGLLDVLVSLAVVAEENHYCRPKLSGQCRQSDFYYYRPKYGRKIDVYATDRLNSDDGANGQFCTGKICRYRTGRPCVYKGRSF